jgi:hypothetical protein
METTLTDNTPKMTQDILGIDTNAKTVKGAKFGYMTGIAYLAPSTESGYNTCQYASVGCKAACLFTAGKGAMSHVKNARVKKTLSFYDNKSIWLNKLNDEIGKMKKKSAKEDVTPCVRLNGTSDLPWERIWSDDGLSIIERNTDIQFYDYTKNHFRMFKFLKGDLPTNYHLTFSRSETNEAKCLEVLANGGNVAVVFRNKLPKTWNGYTVINGDESDLRFKDPKNVVVGLIEKGLAKKDETGFVVEPE